MIAQIVVSHRDGAARPGLIAIARSVPYATLIAVDLILALGIGVGLELLIVPGIVFGTWYALAPIVVETEDRGVLESLRRSRELVRGEFWVVLIILFSTLGLVAALHWPLEALVGTLAAALSEEAQEGIGYLLAAILVKPIGAVITVELTLDLAGRRP